MRPDRELTEKEVEEVLTWTSDSITASLIRDNFTRLSPTQDARWMTNDYFKLPTTKFNTKREGYTTLGIYICNLFLVQHHNLPEIFGYINKSFDGSVIEDFEEKLANALYYDKITTDCMADHYNRIQWLGGNDVMTLLTPSLTPALLKPVPGLVKKKEELFKANAEAVKKGDPIIASKIENELIDMAVDYLKNDEGYENFASKAKSNIPNNYKTMQIMKGALQNSHTGEYRINKSDYNSGISREEYSSFADSSVVGSHARAIGTAYGGYMAKKINQTLNAVEAAEPGSDCGTKLTIDVVLYPSMKNDYMSRFIVEDGHLIELTPENFDKYAGKHVHMRSPIFCKMQEPYYCNKCLGNQPYLLGLTKYGLAACRMANKIMNMSLKKFHDLTIKTTDIDIGSVFHFDN